MAPRATKATSAAASFKPCPASAGMLCLNHGVTKKQAWKQIAENRSHLCTLGPEDNLLSFIWSLSQLVLPIQLVIWISYEDSPVEQPELCKVAFGSQA